MTYQVVVTEAAKRDLFETITWWSNNRSSEQAQQWYAKIIPALQTLSE